MSDKKQFTFDPHQKLSLEVESAFADKQSGDAAAPEVSSIDPQSIGDPVPNPPENYNISPFFDAKVKRALGATQALLLNAGVNKAPPMPDLQSEVYEHVNFARLDYVFNHMDILGWEPEVVVTSTGHSADFWTTLFAQLLKANSDECELLILDNLKEHWDNVVDPEQITIAVLPSGKKVPLRGLPYDPTVEKFRNAVKLAVPKNMPVIKFNEDVPPHSFHPTVETYLTLQGIRSMSRKALLDGESQSWLKGSFPLINSQNSIPPTSIEMHSPTAYKYQVGPEAGKHTIFVIDSMGPGCLTGMRPTVVG